VTVEIKFVLIFVYCISEVDELEFLEYRSIT
jgi:hypothetical protein